MRFKDKVLRNHSFLLCYFGCQQFRRKHWLLASTICVSKRMGGGFVTTEKNNYPHFGSQILGIMVVSMIKAGKNPKNRGNFNV